MNHTQKINSWLRMSVFGSLTLGLAPFFPEPHIWGKILWIMGGAVGMKVLDWFDFFFHGTPWFFLIGLSVYKLIHLRSMDK
ncbi:MAG: hypothetical protein KAI29_20680 [Cyclobacteriaceae bacterium]|nr:hypothetical protein [Cyclobacteriaceae bacterium]